MVCRQHAYVDTILACKALGTGDNRLGRGVMRCQGCLCDWCPRACPFSQSEGFQCCAAGGGGAVAGPR